MVVSKKVKSDVPKIPINTVSTAFLNDNYPEDLYSSEVKTILDALKTNTNFPGLTPALKDVTPLYDTYEPLRLICLTDQRSPKNTTDRDVARNVLTIQMFRIVWYIQCFSNNDASKMTNGTGLRLADKTRKPARELSAPVVEGYEQAGVDPQSGHSRLKIMLKNEPGNRGAQYRLKLEGETDFGQAVSFADNRKRFITGLKPGDKGVFQVRWLGGSKGQSDWSVEVRFIVA